MIADEVICGFGRLGSEFGTTLFGIRPDIMTLAKGLSSGYQPISASVISKRIWSVLEEKGSKYPSFYHGFTYSAHPVAAAAALANLDIVERENLTANARKIGMSLKSALKTAFSDNPFVGDIRGEGLIIGVEIVADKVTKRTFDPSVKFPQRIVAKGYEEGIIVRPVTNLIAMSPPLILSETEVEEFVAGLKRAFGFVTNQVVAAREDKA